MTPEDLKALRKPFDKSQVGLLPKPYKSDSPKGPCKECGGFHGLPAMHLDYVGHAVVTGRLLDIDPEWTWEPMGIDEHGLPATDKAGNLWIRLTILGVTRIGVGDGPSAKIAIGDAIRNAAMRFGVALSLWSKEELEVPWDVLPAPSAAPQTSPVQQAKTRAWNALRALHPTWDNAALTAEIKDTAGGVPFEEVTAEQWEAFAAVWEAAS